MATWARLCARDVCFQFFHQFNAFKENHLFVYVDESVFTVCLWHQHLLLVLVRAARLLIMHFFFVRCWGDETIGKPVFETIVLRTRVKTLRSQQTHECVRKPESINLCGMACVRCVHVYWAPTYVRSDAGTSITASRTYFQTANAFWNVHGFL